LRWGSSFSILSIYLILSLLISERGSLSEMYWPLWVPGQVVLPRASVIIPHLRNFVYVLLSHLLSLFRK